MTDVAHSPTERADTEASQGLTWQLVHAEPGSLVYAVPPPRRQPAGGESSGGWQPAESDDLAGQTAAHEDHPALRYAGYIGRVGVLAAALGVGAALAGSEGIAWAEPSDSDSATSTSSGTESTPGPQRSTRRTPSRQAPSRQAPRSTRTTPDITPDITPPVPVLPGLDVPTPAPNAGSPAGSAVDPLPATTTDDSGTPSAATGSETPAPADDVAAPTETVPERPNETPPTRQQPEVTTNVGAPAEPARPATEVQPTPPVRQIPLPGTAENPQEAAPAPATATTSAPTSGTTSAATSTPTETLPPAPITHRTSPLPQRLPSNPVDRIVGAVLEPLSTPNSPAARTVSTTASWSLLAWVQRTFFNRQPSLAYNPTQSTQVDDVVTGTVNALDPDGDALTYTATPPVNGGTVSIAPNGTFTYTPTAALAAAGGIDSFQVTATDAGSGFHLHGISGLLNLITFGIIGDPGHSATTTVTVDVNAAPVPAAPPYTLGSAEPTTGRVGGEFHVTDADADTLSYTVTGGPANGSVVLSGDGTFTYTPTATARHDASAEDAGSAELNDTFIVKVDDNHGRSVDIPVTVAIDPTNTSPTVTAVTVSDPDSDGTVTVSVTVADPDNDPVTYLVIHDPSYGSVAPTAGGFSFTPTAQARHDAAGTPGIDTDSFQFTASDLHHGIDTATASVVISPANIAPSGLTQSVNVPNPVTGVVTGTVTGTDADGDPLTYSGSATTAKGAVIVDPDGTFAYTPTGAARHNAAADGATTDDKQDTFTVTADDAHGGTADLAVTVAVSPSNIAPVSSGVTTTAPAQNGAITGSVNTTDADGDTLSYTVTSDAGKGSVTVNPDGSFTYTPTPAARHTAAADNATTDDKRDVFVVTADDAHGGTTDVSVAVVVSPANNAPVGTAVPGSPDPASGVVNGVANFTDADNDPLTYSGSATTAKGSVTVNPDGTFTYTPTDDARHDAAADTATPDDKKDGFTLTVDDGHGSVQDVAVTVAIGSANAAPVVTVVVPQPNPATGEVTGTINATDTDGDTLTYSGSTTTAKGSVTVNPDGTFTYTPTDDARHAASADSASLDDRQDTFTVTVNDGHGSTVGSAVLVSVSPTNQAPTGTAIPGSPDPVSGQVTGSVSASDPEGDPLTYSGSTSTAKGSVTVNPDGTFTYTPTDDARHNAAADAAGAEDKLDSFTVTIDDAHGGQTSVTVDVAIGAANAAPTIDSSVGIPDPGTGEVTGGVIATDPDNDTLTYTVGTAPTKGTVTVSGDGAFSYTPTGEARHNASADGAGTDLTQDTFTVTVDDGHGSVSEVSVVVQVAPTNAAPTAHPAFGDPGATGVVGGSLVATDTDGDTLTYTVTTPPAGGTVTLYGDGTFSYDPTDAARLKAGITQSPDTDGFTVTVTDGHGGVTVVPVNGIVVAPAQLAVQNVAVGGPSYAMAADGDTVYASSPGKISVIDTTTDPDSVVYSIPAVGVSSGMAVSGDRLYVASWNSSSVAVIDTTTNTVVKTIGVSNPMGVAVSGGQLYVADYGSPPYAGNQVTVVDLGTNSVVGTIPVGAYPYGVAASGNTVYVANSGSNTVSVIDTATRTQTQTIGVGYRPMGLAVNGNRLYVTNFNSNTVSVIDTTTNTVVGNPIPVGSQPNSVSMSSDGSLAYVVNSGDGTVSVIDTATNTVIDAVRVGNQPAFAQAGPNGTTFVSNNGSSNISVLSLVTGQNTAPATQTPAYTVDNMSAVTGVVDGGVRVSDAQFDVLHYTTPATSAKGGTVTVNQAGVFTYTPTTTLRHNASADTASDEDKVDSFTVTVTDAHGASVAIPVAVPISPANAAPTASPTAGTPDAITGVVTGSVRGADSDSDTLTYTLNQAPASGTVTVNPDGTFTYDPTDLARLKAGLTQGEDTDAFTVTVTDGHGGKTVVPVAGVTVSPAQLGVSDTIPVGSDQRSVVITPDGSTAYVSNSGSQSVSVIDTSTNTVVKTITSGFDYPVGMALSPDGGTLYVTNWSNGYTPSPLTVIDTGTNTVVGSIPVGYNSNNVVVSADGSRAYVTNYGSHGGSSLSVVDTQTRTEIAEIPISGRAAGVGLNGDGSRAYVTNANYDVYVIDTATNTIVGDIWRPSPVGAVTMSPDGSRAYIAGPNVSVIDTSTNSVVGTIASSQPQGGAFSPDGTVLYMTDSGTGTVLAIDPLTNTVIDSATVGTSPAAVAVHPNGDAYVVNVSGSSVTVLSLITGQNAAPLAQDPAYSITAVNPVNGTVTGVVKVTDPNADVMSYVTSPTTGKGSAVTVSPTGTFSYTPTATVRHEAAAEGAPVTDTEETFTVKVLDSHGLSTSVPVTVTITPANAAPVSSGATVGVPNASGAVTGALNVTDADADPLSYALTTAPALGRVSVDPATGAFTYTPYTASRVGVYSTPAIETDTFTVTVTDGHGGTRQVAVSAVPVSAVDGVTTASVSTGPSPYGVALSPNGSQAYVTNYSNNTVSVVDTATNTVTGTIGVGANPYGVAVTPNGKYVYVANRSGGTVSVIDAATKSVVQTVTVGSGPQGVAVSPNGDFVYVTNRGSQTVSVIDANPVHGGAYNTVIASVPVGGDPLEVAFTPDSTQAYVIRGTGTVAVIDTATSTEVATIAVGNTPYDVVFSPDGKRAYVPNLNSYTVSVIDTATRSVTTTFAMPNKPTAVALSPDGSLAYVTTMTGNSVVLINTATGAVLDTVPFNTGSQLYGVATSPDGIHAYVPNYISGQLSTITLESAPNAVATVGSPDGLGNVTITLAASDPAGQPITVTNTTTAQGMLSAVDNGNGTWTYTYNPTDAGRLRAGKTAGTDVDSFTVTVTDSVGVTTKVGVTVPLAAGRITLDKTLTVGTSPNDAAVSPDGQRIYVTNQNSNTVSVINAVTKSVIATVPVAWMPVSVAMSPGGQYAYVTSVAGNTVSFIDTASNTVTGTVTVGDGPYDLTVTPDGSHLYVTKFNGGSVQMIDTASKTIDATITGFSSPWGVALNPDATRAYVANNSAGTVSVVNLATNTKMADISVPGGPTGVAVSPDGGRVYVASQSGYVTAISTASNGIIGAVPVGTADSLTVSPDGSLVYVVNRNFNTVSVIDTATLTVIDTVNVGGAPRSVTLSPDGMHLYVVNNGSNTVSMFTLYYVA